MTYAFALVERAFAPALQGVDMQKKSKVKKVGKAKKIIRHPDPAVPEKVEIALEGADELYSEIRIENTLENKRGESVKLKKDAPVEVVVEAGDKDTMTV
jgi:hypothetical protein